MTNEEAIKYLKTMAECKKEIAEKLGLSGINSQLDERFAKDKAATEKAIKALRENQKLKNQSRIESYDPNAENVVHTIRITLMQYDYTGHIAYNISGNCKGASLLDARTLFECWGQDEIDNFVENDCEFGYDEDYEIFTAVLLNDKGETLEIEADESEMQDMVVAVEFVKVEECEEEDA